MDGSVKKLYIALCAPVGQRRTPSGQYTNRKICKKPFTASTNIANNYIAIWGVCLVNLFKHGKRVELIKLMPEYTWRE